MPAGSVCPLIYLVFSDCRTALSYNYFTFLGLKFSTVNSTALILFTFSNSDPSHKNSQTTIQLETFNFYIPFTKPAHSRDTYEAPIHSVLPGQYGKENKSSLK